MTTSSPKKWTAAFNTMLREKLFLMFFFVTVLPLLLFIAYSHSFIKNELTDQTYSNMALSVSQINRNLENKLDAYAKISSSLYLDHLLYAHLNRDYTNDSVLFIDAYRYFNNTINNILTTNPDIHSLSIYTSNPTIPLDNSYIRPVDDKFRQTPLYRALANTKGSIRFLVHTDETEGSPIFTLARLLNYGNEKSPFTLLTINILEAEIYSLIEKEAVDKSIFIIDENGTILSTNEKEMLNADLADYLHNGIGDGASGRFDDTFREEKVLVVYNTTKYDWKTVSVVPYQNFISKAQTATKRIIAIALISIALLAALIYTVAQMFTKRVINLLRMFKRVERGDFTAQIQPLGHDEIGQIGLAFNRMVNRLNTLINEVYKIELDKKEAEMNLLQSQINPHFLYNTLASISSLAIQNADHRMNKIVTDLAKFYRISLNKGKTVLPIAEEIKLTRYYVSILQIRFSNLIRVHYKIDESVLPISISKLTLQPFIENCVNHAIWDAHHTINIIIHAYRDGRDIILKVIDDGQGMRPSPPSAGGDDKSSGYGILNVDRRIKLLFGDTYGVTLYSRLGIGTTVLIRIPG